ncbi:hypothetical protein ESA94_15585 [Lacibacter luteus]|uniref:N-acetylmuramoyl-L-alanine amidase n=1 Tax=Lacibacter luteus TaxID=2508719 RepID=A0A4Q1CG70_9BACT|nr:N-acetylmuramoyl-L-alanine amidase [Lacibacter luteus]RXK58811.1 hypothetical protein ESA94_15585 [Lacibacter luteus]
MTALTEYLLKVIICSGVLTAYYWLALRNKIFHQWNRFYLLAAVVLSLTLPLLQFQLWYHPAEQTATSYKVLQTITTNETWFEEDVQQTASVTNHFTTEHISTYLYLIVSLLIFAGFIKALVQIFRLYKKYQHWKTEQLVFVDTDAKGTPFSFFNYIFWNRNIAFESIHGQQIFAHELVHVKEKHSLDKLFLNLLLIAFWINPFFWLIRKELSMIHEFIADKKAVQDQDSSALAAMILASAFPGHTLPFTNPFFYSPIKRRLLMLSKLKNPKASYISRLLLLPLLTFLVTAFAVKINRSETNLSPFSELEQPLTVVIDAAHGYKNGIPTGVRGLNNLQEDEVVLAICNKIKALNKDVNLKLVFTRPTETDVALNDRLRIATEQNADLFISIHAAYAPPVVRQGTKSDNPANGVEIYVAKDGTPYLDKSKQLGLTILGEMKDIMAIREPAIKQREKGIYVIQSAPFPSILIECGFISNKNDAEFVSNEKNQEQIAAAILKGIVNYASGKNKASDITTITNTQNDTIPNSNKKVTKLISDSILVDNNTYNNHLIIINGKKSTRKMTDSLLITAKTVTVIPKNNKDAITKYGSEAKDGVIIFEDAVITEKNTIEQPQQAKDTLPKNTNSIPEGTPIFTKAEIMPQFPGGELAWNRYMEKVIRENIDALTAEGKDGLCEVEFIVTPDGFVSKVKAKTMQNTKLAEVLIEAIKKGPKWVPAIQNGRKVYCRSIQKINLRLPVSTTSITFN